jgi:hypothetical protein
VAKPNKVKGGNIGFIFPFMADSLCSLGTPRQALTFFLQYPVLLNVTTRFCRSFPMGGMDGLEAKSPGRYSAGALVRMGNISLGLEAYFSIAEISLT